MNFRWPPAWLLVLVGLVLNILAILMSSVVLEDLSSKMSGFNERKQDNLYSIQLAWNRVETLERKKELALIYLSQSDSVSHSADASLVASELTKQLSDWVGEPVPSLLTTNLNQIMAVIERAQKTQREQIDNFYLQNLTFNERLSALDEQIAWYRNISLFLQVFGLALILARDLARK
ncbi:DNA mismatch repair protein [Vibrio fluminensis]|uniref:DNA mismatch repair protein n=1 Tax=Vibrio fluminensis TaxID=2783614 RepID=UPI001887D604|nr:DNA mismatch repair protein [Vibrio fluminensis]